MAPTASLLGNCDRRSASASLASATGYPLAAGLTMGASRRQSSGWPPVAVAAQFGWLAGAWLRFALVAIALVASA
jgi:hypothetical protein